jgi:hypothetical protein
MAINTENINTKGAVITVGGVIPLATNPDGDGYYWGTVSGTDVGCTTGGVKVTYSFEKNDIYCDQALSPVESSIVSESVEVSLNMLESDAAKLQLAIQQCEYLENVGVERKIGVGGLTTITYVPLKLEIADNDTGFLTTWTFFRVLSNGIEINFDRANPTQVTVTFVAYADTSHAEGHQLFSIHEALV